MDISPQNVFAKEPIIATPERRRQKKLIYVLAGSVLITLLVLYFGFSSGSQAPATPGAPPATAPEVSSSGQSQASFEQRASAVENLTFDFSIFNNEKFQSLKTFGASLDISGAKGRSNPFQPY